jgi:hypothetical protein
MKVYVSSTFVDLQEYRAAAIRMLRQLGHEVTAMEDYVADSAIPLKKVLDDVQSCDAYVGIFAWRYGYVPGAPDIPGGPPEPPPPDLVLPDPTRYGDASITEWEYLQAKKDENRPVLAFLLDEGVPWPPHLIDGFEAGTNKEKIHNLRATLQRERIVAYFKSPESLEARVGAAITTVNMSKQVALNLLDPARSTPGDLQLVSHGEGIKDSGKSNFVEAIVSSQAERIFRIDIANEWWSTRLYLLAYLVRRLTEVRRILVVEGDEFVALLSTEAIKRHLKPLHPQLDKFDQQMGRRHVGGIDLRQEIDQILAIWDEVLPIAKEREVKRPVNRVNLHWWFGDAMLEHALKVVDLSSATAFDLARLLDFPSDYVPVITTVRSALPAPTVSNSVKVVDKNVLNAELARNYLNDLLNRSGIQT